MYTIQHQRLSRRYLSRHKLSCHCRYSEEPRHHLQTPSPPLFRRPSTLESMGPREPTYTTVCPTPTQQSAWSQLRVFCFSAGGSTGTKFAHCVSAAVRATRVLFQDSPQGDTPGQQLYHVRAEQLGELGLPGCDEALSGMGGASLTNEVPGVM